MKKKVACVLLSVFLLFPTAGCWDYHGLNEITIVSGVAVDFDASNGDYMITCEIVDNTSMKNQVLSKIVEARGKTLLDAVRNAKRRAMNKLYWGNTRVAIIGRDMASQIGVSSVVDWFLSDPECRETVPLIISNEKTAGDLLKTEQFGSYMLRNIINDDQFDTSSIRSLSMYQIYNILKAQGESLTLPIFHLAENDGKKLVETYGEALFKDDKMVGMLNAEESKYYLFAVNGVNGGVLPLYSANKNHYDITLEIANSKSKTSFTNESGAVTMQITINTNVYLEEVNIDESLVDEALLHRIEFRAEEMIEQRIKSVVQKVQKEYGTDVFGFGNQIYKKNPSLWETMKSGWDTNFQKIKVNVTSKVTILNSAFLDHN